MRNCARVLEVVEEIELLKFKMSTTGPANESEKAKIPVAVGQTPSDGPVATAVVNSTNAVNTQAEPQQQSVNNTKPDPVLPAIQTNQTDAANISNVSNVPNIPNAQQPINIPPLALASVQPNASNNQNTQNTEKEDKSDSDDDGAEEILEESPDKRWSKRRERVKQRDIPGVDATYLAMDNETGRENLWNEVQFSERKNFRDQEEKLKAVFDNLTNLAHTNLVRFHKYWTDSKSEKPRIIFITEYLPSGSLYKFLHRARSSGTPINIKMWKKWATQILSALNYLHSCDPPIVHANLTSNTVFIQQNGSLKIGCVAPNAIHHHVKTCRENLKNMHYIAPEFDHLTEATIETDIYSFGICALEMATTGGLSCNGSGSSEGQITSEVIRKTIDSLEDPKVKDFIELCLAPDPSKRPTARQLLSHQALFEVYKETRSIIHMQANIEGNYLKTVLRMDDMMNRQLMTEIHKGDNPDDLTADLVECGFICEADSTKICNLLRSVLSSNDE